MNRENLLEQWLNEELSDVRECADNLYRAQEILDRYGVIEGRLHRFLLIVERR